MKNAPQGRLFFSRLGVVFFLRRRHPKVTCLYIEREFPALLVFWTYQQTPLFLGGGRLLAVFLCFLGVFCAFGVFFCFSRVSAIFFSSFLFFRRHTTPKLGIPALCL